MLRKQEVSDALQKELGAPKQFAENVQSNMFPFHMKQALKMADTFEWTKDLGQTLIVKEPIGVVAAITPWNWPLVTPINAYVLAEAIHASGLPPGVFNMVCGTGADVGEIMATHPLVDMVSFTGSTAVGRHLHAVGAATLKRVRSELGGKSATIVLEDATEEQIRLMATHVIGNTGQSCNALSRLLAPRCRYDEVVEIARAAFEGIRVVAADDASAEAGDIGPLASRQQYAKVRGYIQTGIDEGARLVAGGLEAPPNTPSDGYFVRPTVFSDVNQDMTIAREEIFGPVLCILAYDSEEQAITMANDTIYGLNNAVVGADQEHAMRVAARLRSGQVQVNTTSGSPLAPFGGYKQSGDGREWGEAGLEEFLQIKAINRPKSKL